MEQEEKTQLEHEHENLKLRWVAVNAACKEANRHYTEVTTQRHEVEGRIGEIEKLLAPPAPARKKKG